MPILGLDLVRWKFTSLTVGRDSRENPVLMGAKKILLGIRVPLQSRDSNRSDMPLPSRADRQANSLKHGARSYPGK